MTLLYSDPIFLKHVTGRHPECPDRLRTVIARLEAAKLIEKCRPGTFKPIEEQTVLAVHDAAVVDRAKKLAAHGGGHLDADTVVCPDSFAVALHAAGACVAAVDAVVAGKDLNALCLVRPPGHHATVKESMGFCLFNNIALAAHHARKKHELNRILIVDWDVHHGNGTQDVFYSDPSYFFLSVHRFGHGFYPGTGAADETGAGRGLGFTRNVPLHFGISRSEFRSAFREALERAADKMKPELILLSAGFDAHARDPVGSLGLETEDFTTLSRDIQEVAKVHCGGRLVSCLEGGYDLDALAWSVQAHLEELLKVQAS
jgi:acetoin utilization deacetylase AcuC-like enzyme